MTEVRPFFERYGRAFEAYNAEAIAAAYVAPCLFVRDGQTVAAGTSEAVLESVHALLDIHRAWDVKVARPAEVALLEQTPTHALVRVGWKLGRPGSRVEWSFATTYTLVPGADDWQIAVAVTHDAPF